MKCHRYYVYFIATFANWIYVSKQIFKIYFRVFWGVCFYELHVTSKFSKFNEKLQGEAAMPQFSADRAKSVT